MKRRVRGKLRTVLDRLEVEGIILPPFAKKLRSDVEQDRLPPAKELQGNYLMLLAALMLPDRRDSRIALQRNFAIALEHAYDKLIDPAAAIKHTADAAGIPRRTVSNAIRNSSVPEFVIPTLVNMMNSPDEWHCATEEESKAAIKQMMREKPQSTRNRELRKGLAKIRKAVTSPRRSATRSATKPPELLPTSPGVGKKIH